VEVYDDVTGTVSTARIEPDGDWPPVLAALESTRRRDADPAAEPLASSPAEREEMAEEVAEADPSGAEMVGELLPEVGISVADVGVPEGPTVAEVGDFQVNDDPDSLSLKWEDGVTELGRRMHIAPFADGMWVIFENKGEYLVFLNRGSPTEFESQDSLREAKASASVLSKESMGLDQGSGFSQEMAELNARQFVQWVGPRLEFEGEAFAYRRGRVRRERATVIVTYAGEKTESGRPRIEIRLTPTATGDTLALWAIRYGAEGVMIGSYDVPDLNRADLGSLEIQFGPVPGKTLSWERVTKHEEIARWGAHELVIKQGVRVSGLLHRVRGRDDFLDCSTDVAALKTRALNVFLRHLRSRPRGSGAGSPDAAAAEQAAAASVEPAPTAGPEVAEPEQDPAEQETTAEPEQAAAKPTPKAPKRTRITKTMRKALRALHRKPGEETFESINKKTRDSLVSKGLLNEHAELTRQGREAIGLEPEEPAEPEPAAPDEGEEDREERDDYDEDLSGISSDQARAMDGALSSGVAEVISELGPPPAE